MIRINSINVPLDFSFSDLRGYCTKTLRIKESELKSVRLAKKSVDARRKNDVHFTISLDIECTCEERLLKRMKNASRLEPFEYSIEKHSSYCGKRPAVIGFGPAGMFAALVLAEAGAKPIVLERGRDVDERCRIVEKFRTEGRLDTECNVQFGEGGAGTFSDGKLTTGTNDRRIGFVLEQLVRFGAPDEILYLAKPHIGTDKLRETVKSLRRHVISLGGEVRFGSKFCGFGCDNGRLNAVQYEDAGGLHTIDTDFAVLAAGHSARDVFEMLYSKNVELAQKNFSVGVRIEHKRTDIDRAMYGDFAGHPALKAADYKLVSHLPNGRSLYTFCMCPGGYVMAASSEEGHLAVNGMSCFARDAENSNSALLVGINTSDYGSEHPLAGMYFQRDIEKKAFTAGGSDYSAPVITVGDFLSGTCSERIGSVSPSYRPSVKYASPDEYLPDFVCETLRYGIADMGRRIKGFDSPDAMLTGVESRSSSPVRICRDENLQSVSAEGLFPCGEGAGYAGGIVSAAVDGIKCAEKIIELIDWRNGNEG